MKITQSWVLIVLLMLMAINVHAWPMPDTGQTTCYDNTSETACPQPGQNFYGQDAQYEGPVRSYTKLGKNGVVLPSDATETEGWLITRDNVTGLIWEMKIDDGGIRDKDNTYTWANAQGVFIATLNQENFGGFSDWRLPTIMELSSLVNSTILFPGPTIDAAWFPRTESSAYWSSTTDASNTYYAWLVGFNDGYVNGYHKSNSCYVRAVRAGQ